MTETTSDSDLVTRIRGRAASTGTFLLRFLRDAPASIALAVAFTITSIATGTIGGGASAATVDTWAAGGRTTVVEGHWWSPVSALLIPWDPFQLVVSIIAAIALLGIAERLIGTVRTLVAFLVTGVLGITFVVLFAAGGSLIGDWWSLLTTAQEILDPTIGIVGAVMAASAAAGPLWRRRIRILTLTVVLVFTLYDGDISNACRLAATVLGTLLGALFLRDASTLRPKRSSRREGRSLIAVIVAVTAIGPVVSLANPLAFSPLSLVAEDYRTNGIDGIGPVVAIFIPLALLILAAWGLKRGRRFAFWLAIVVNAGLAALTAIVIDIPGALSTVRDARLGGVSTVEVFLWATPAILLPVAVIVMLIATRRLFAVRSGAKANATFAVWTTLVLVVLAAVYFVAALVDLGAFRPAIDGFDLLFDTALRFLPTQFSTRIDPAHAPPGLVAFLAGWVGVVFWIVFIGGAWLLMRDVDPLGRATDIVRIRRLLRSGAGGSLSYMATWPGNTYWFTADGTGAVAYRVVNGVAITLADPISLPENDRETVHGFVAFCDDNNWTPAFYSVHPRIMPVFEELGWQSMPVGEETLVDLPGFSLTGKAWQSVRSSLNRGVKEGMTTLWTTWNELPLPYLVQINAISEAWIADKELPEMGFTLGGMDELRDREVKMMLAVDPEDRVHAVTSWMPVYSDGRPIGWVLDFMRRAEDSMNGAMEFLIASTALHVKEQGAHFISLSGAPLATKPVPPGEVPPDPTAMTRLLDFLSKVLEPAYGFTTLFRFKAKFNPRYETIAMAYPDALALPAIGIAIGRAYVPDVSAKEAIALVRTLAG